jgi:acetolactate synthase I/II/III large subunit
VVRANPRAAKLAAPASAVTTSAADKVAAGLGCHGEYAERAADIAPAIKRALASGQPGVVHVAVDPKADSEEMPSYAEFRAWCVEGMQ